VDDATPITAPAQLSESDWLSLLHLAHTDPSEGFRRYTGHYLSSHGQTYWSDTHQLSPYLPGYSAALAALSPGRQKSSLLISELFVPRPLLATFLREAARILRAGRVPLIYGTIRLSESDDDSFLAWAKSSHACIIFNLLTTHTPAGQAVSAHNEGLLPLTQTAMLIRGDLAFHDYEGVAVDLSERERLVADLGTKNAMILRNHGTLAVGKNVGECFIRLYYLERACQAQVMALSAGDDLSNPPQGSPELTAQQGAVGLPLAANLLAWPAL
jgi:hypothetical protein